MSDLKKHLKTLGLEMVVVPVGDALGRDHYEVMFSESGIANVRINTGVWHKGSGKPLPSELVPIVELAEQAKSLKTNVE